jgi:hypothetical protein
LKNIFILAAKRFLTHRTSYAAQKIKTEKLWLQASAEKIDESMKGLPV